MKLKSNRKTQLLVYKHFRKKFEKENKDLKKKFQPKTIIEDAILVTLN